MPKNKVSDPITDQEMAFARQVLAGGMTDRQAAEAVGLRPDSAAYIKSKPQVRAYMLEHRAAVQQQLAQQEAEALHRANLDRAQVLARLWEIANLSPEMTRGSITGQVKAISMIVAIQNLIPNSRALSAEKKSAPAQEQDGSGVPKSPASGSPAKVSPEPGPSRSITANSSEAPKSFPYVPLYGSIPDLKVPFSLPFTVDRNPFVRPR